MESFSPRTLGRVLLRLTPMLFLSAALVLLLPASFSLAGANNGSAAASSASSDNAEGPTHCDDGGPGHKDCPPENNPNPDNPPCNADHGHPGQTAPQCQEGPPGDESCSDGEDNDGDGLTDGDDPDCEDDGGGDACENAGGDSDGDGVCDDDDNCPGTANADQSDGDEDGVGDACDTEGPAGDASCSDGFDNDGDGLIDAQDPDCQTSGETDPCTAEHSDAGLLTEDTIGQTAWDSGASALTPLTEDPDRDGAVTGPVGEAGQGTPAEVVFDEVTCAADLVIDPSLGGDL